MNLTKSEYQLINTHREMLLLKRHGEIRLTYFGTQTKFDLSKTERERFETESKPTE